MTTENEYPAANTGSSPSSALLWAVGLVLAGMLAIGMVSGRNAAAGEQFTHFTGKNIDQELIDTETFKGKVMVVDFWATWCPPCVEKIPTLNKIQEKYGEKGLQVVGVSGDASPEDIRNFQSRTNVNFPTIFHGAEPIMRAYEITAFPTIMVVNREGKIVYRGHSGNIESYIEASL